MPSGVELRPTIASSPVLFSVPQWPLQSGKLACVWRVGPAAAAWRRLQVLPRGILP